MEQELLELEPMSCLLITDTISKLLGYTFIKKEKYDNERNEMQLHKKSNHDIAAWHEAALKNRFNL